jgi:hypothetical protein
MEKGRDGASPPILESGIRPLSGIMSRHFSIIGLIKMISLISRISIIG